MDENGDYLMVLAEAQDVTIKRADIVLKDPIQTRRLAYTKESIFAKTLENREINQTTDIASTLYAIMPDISEELVQKVLEDK